MNFTIKGLKTWATHEGGGFQFSLYRDGKKFAWIHNEGNGGPLDITYEDTKDKPNADSKFRREVLAFLPSCKWWDEWEKQDQEFREKYRDFEHSEAQKLNLREESLMYRLLEDHEFAQKIARLRKKSTLFRLLTDAESVVRSVNTLDIEQAKRVLEKHHPNNYQFI